MKRVLLLLFAAILGCSRKAETPAPHRLTPVSVNLNPSLTYAPIMIAKDEGFFADEGIDLQLASLDSNSGLAALVAGKLDVLSTGVRAGIFNMIRRGVPIAIVADKSHSSAHGCSAEAFAASPEMARRIAAKGSLRGERLAVVRGGVGEYLMAMLLERYKATEKDVVLVQMPQGSPITSGQELDAVRYLAEPHLSSMTAAGTVQRVATSDEVAPGHLSTVIVYGKRMLRDDPELGRRFMRAYLRGVRRFSEGKSDRNVAILARWTKMTPEEIRAACWFTAAQDGRVDPRSAQPFLDWALEKHYLDGPIAPSAWWNPAFVDAVR